MTNPDNLRQELKLLNLEIGELGMTSEQINQLIVLFNSKLDKIVSEIEGEKITSSPFNDPVSWNEALTIAKSIIQNNKEKK